MSKEEIDLFWKHEFQKALEYVSPGFTIDERNKALIAELYTWVWSRMGRSNSGMFDPQKGLLLWGNIGTGKTTLLKGIQRYMAVINQLVYGCNNKDICFELRSASEISLRYAKDGLSALERWVDKDTCNHLIIDEIGREEVAKNFGTTCNTIQMLLQLRYELRQDCTTMGTTNINMQSSQFSELYGDYVTDRIKEMFNIIEISGSSRRTA